MPLIYGPFLWMESNAYKCLYLLYWYTLICVIHYKDFRIRQILS